MNRKSLLFVCVVFVAGISGCGSQHGPPAIVVSLIPTPPASIEVQVRTALSATVTGDAQNGGVDWAVTCGSTDCGSFNPAHTASGANTMYTAPSTPPAGGTVTVTAKSTDSTNGASASATITITPVASASNLTGQYAFYVSGYDFLGYIYVAAGSVTLDGMGNVTAGEEDFNDNRLAAPSVDDTLTGTYSVGPQGRGTLLLTATTAGGIPDTNVGVGGLQTISFAVVNDKHALIEEFDANASSAGSMDLQTTTAISDLTGGYSFYWSGAAKNSSGSESGAVVAGVMTADGMGNFTSNADVDSDIGGSTSFGESLSGSLAGPTLDPMGRGVLTYGGAEFAVYVVGPEVMRMVSIGSPSLAVAGSAFGQGSGSGSFSNASLSGPFVFTSKGFSLLGFNEQVGMMKTDGSGSISSGVIDYNEGNLIPPSPPEPDSINAGKYAVASNGYGSATATVPGDSLLATYGLYMTDPALNLSDPNNTVSGGGAALIVELDTASLGYGFLVPQTSTSAAPGNNAINLDGDIVALEFQGIVDVVGQINSDGFSTYAGAGDANIIFAAPPREVSAAPLAGTFKADATNVGRYTGTLNLNNAVTPYGQVFYQANSGLALYILEDVYNVASGVIEGQQ